MTKLISVSEEAYSRLAKLKGTRSFTKVILALTEEKNDISKFFGILKMSEEDAKKLKNKLKSERENMFAKGYHGNL